MAASQEEMEKMGEHTGRPPSKPAKQMNFPPPLRKVSKV